MVDASITQVGGRVRSSERQLEGAPVRTDVVPYIARWSGEQRAAWPVVVGRKRRGIAYADERSFDRDQNGILWTRVPSQPGRGRPQYGKVHSLRQRLAMSGLRCQICGKPADRNGAGVLWLIDADPADPGLRAGEEHTAHPPVCRPCATRSMRACPHLRRGCVALRVRSWTQVGVGGFLYQPASPVPVIVEAGRFRLDDPCLPWVLANQLMVTLTDFTITASELTP